MARRRSLTTFNLSFLDIMSCGFGAVVLIFLMMDHASRIYSEEINRDSLAEVNLLDEDIREGEENRVRARNSIALVDQQMAEAQGLSRRIMEEIKAIEDERTASLDESSAQQQHINALKSDLKSLEQEKKRLEAEEDNRKGQQVRRFVGEGDRQYLTGLKLGGHRILVLLDTSASMLDHTIVNIIRRRNMSDAVKLRSEKWQRALETVDWLTTQLPANSWYQIYTFNTAVSPALKGTLGDWLQVSDAKQMGEAIKNLKGLIPDKGTSLYQLFAQVRRLAPRPDNIILITDGLPTQGDRKPHSATVSGQERERLFKQALKELPTGIPVNVILMPMEGDPLAASSFWKLAMTTGGAFIAPSKDWP